MRIKVVLLCFAVAALAAGCKKKGGGGGWFVGDEGLMADVSRDGELGEGYDLGETEDLYAIACRYLAEAWVAGAHGTVLHTADGGETWGAHDLGTTADLRALATQDAGAVFVAGEGVFFAATPDRAGAATWAQLGDGATRFRSVAAAQRAETVLALSEDGGLWSYGAGALARQTTLAGARALAVSPDGTRVIAAGAGLQLSVDGGRSWAPIAAAAGLELEAVRLDDSGTAVAVGAHGLVARADAEGRVLTQHLGDATLRTLHLRPPGAYSGTGYAAGDGGQIWSTRDAGWTWTRGPNVGRTVLGADEIGEGHN